MNAKYERYIDYIVDDLEAPYFINMRDNYGLRPDEYEMVLSKVFNQPFTIKGDMVYNQLGNIIYYENSNGHWDKKEYDNQGNIIYFENSKGNWEKYEYDDQGNEIYYEDSTSYWYKYEYDNQGNIIYYENSSGFWKKWEYDTQGNITYYEDSDGIIDDRR